jgi:hypothetical protein
MAFKIQALCMALVTMGLMSGCISSATLTKHMNNSRASLAYIQDTKPVRGEKKFFIHVDMNHTLKGLSDDGKAYRLKSIPVPLIMFNYWQQIFEYRLGRNQIAEDVADFTRSAMVKEINRSCSFGADTTSSTTSNLRLVMEFDKIDSHGQYKNEGVFIDAVYFFVYVRTQKVGPATSTTDINYKLLDGDRILLENKVSSLVDQKFIALKKSPISEFRKGYKANLVEQVSLSIKNNIQQIARETDLFLSTYQPLKTITGSVSTPDLHRN